MKDHFHFTILTKPYIAKYLQTLYGNPVIFDADNYFGTTLIGFLTKKIYKLRETKIEHRKFDQFTTQLDIYLPSYWLRNYMYKTDLTRENIIYINKHFEQKFEEELTRHCYLLNLLEIEYRHALEDFCYRYNIEIDVDITFDCIKQKEYRERENFKNKLAKNDLKKYIQPRLL
jgi:hypothetical protein